MGNSADFITAMMSAVANCSLYADQHQIVRELNEKAFKYLVRLFAGGTLSITLLGNSLIFNEEQLTEKGLHIDKFISRMRRKKIDKVIISSSVTREELLMFITGMASKKGLQSSPSISFGIVELEEATDARSTRDLADENIARLRRLFEGVRGMEPIDTAGLDDIVSGLISSLRSESNVLKVISPLRDYNEYTYVHATNVSVITVFLAESLGIGGELLYDIGLSALMHDIGKMFIPTEVLDKNAGLDSGEWDIMKKHPVYGARYLSGLPGVSKLSIIVAYEHHMRYNGAGYPERPMVAGKQHLVSQMVAIADFFDAMRSERPYRSPAGIEEIRSIMLGSSGRDFNPDLAESFWQAMDRFIPDS